MQCLIVCQRSHRQYLAETVMKKNAGRARSQQAFVEGTKTGKPVSNTVLPGYEPCFFPGRLSDPSKFPHQVDTTSPTDAQRRSSKVSTKHLKGTMKRESIYPQWKNHVQTENVAILGATELGHTVFC